MAVTITGRKAYPCGCVASYLGDARVSAARECADYHQIMGSMLADKRPQTKEVSAFWRGQFNAHFGE